MADAEAETKLVHEGWSDITEKKRGCTDVLFFLLLIAAWIAMSIIGLIVTGMFCLLLHLSLQQPPLKETHILTLSTFPLGAIPSNTLTMGNPYRLMNSVDYTNHICGYDNGVTSLPYGYYLPDKTSICVSSCPSVTDYTKFICQYDIQNAVNADPYKVLGLYYLAKEQCMYNIKSKVVLNRCVPQIDTASAAKAFATYRNLTGTLPSLFLHFHSFPFIYSYSSISSHASV